MTPRLRFPRSARLVQTAEFRRVRSGGRKWKGRFIVLTVLDLESQKPARLGVVTSRRVGGAVDRNRVRRRLREVLRQARPALRAGCWLVITARRAAAAASCQVLREEWLRLASRASILSLCAS
jgi:ribonuclease P protein component